MNSKLWIRKALSLCLSVAILATYSMVALAGPGKVAGELTVSGKDINGEAPFVLVNGEAARSGRSIFSTSTITTPEGAGAAINLGKLGRLDLAPSTALTLTFDETGVSADLTAGVLSVFGSTEKVLVKTLDGKTVQLAAGHSVAASGKLQDKDDDDDDGGAAWWIWAGVFGGAAAVILWTAISDQDIAISGDTTVVSPTR